MPFDVGTLEGITSMVDGAVVDPTRWDKALERLRVGLDASGAALFSPTPAGAAGVLSATSGCAGNFLPDYFRKWLGRGPWLEAAAKGRSFQHSGAVEFGRSVLPLQALRRTEFYADFLRPHDIEGVVSIKITDSSEPRVPMTLLALYRPSSVPDFGKGDRAALQALWHPLRRAVHAHYLLCRASSFDQVAEDALDALPDPTLVVRQDMRVDFANRAARECGFSNALDLSQGRLVSVGDFDGVTLREAVRSNCGGAWAVGIDSGGRLQRGLLRIVPVTTAPSLMEAWPHSKALVILRLPLAAAEQSQWLKRLARRYRLTAAESRVLAQLAAGLEPRDIADELRVSYATVRTHLRMLYEKTGCRRQAALLRLVLGE